MGNRRRSTGNRVTRQNFDKEGLLQRFTTYMITDWEAPIIRSTFLFREAETPQKLLGRRPLISDPGESQRVPNSVI